MHSDSDQLSTEQKNTEDNQSKWKKFRQDKEIDASSKETAPEGATVVEDQPQEKNNPLEEENNSLKEALEQQKKAFLYAKAEVQNTQRQCKREIEEAKLYAGTTILKAFIPVLEGIEAANAQEETVTLEQLKEGSKNIASLMQSTFQKLGVTEVSATIGEAFNPNLHSAVGTEASEISSNTIAKVLRKGYQLHSRVLQAAMVIVTKREEPTEKNNASELEK